MTFFSGIFIIDLIAGVVLIMMLIDIFVAKSRKKRGVKHGIPFHSYRIGYEMLGLLGSVLYASVNPIGWLMVVVWFYVTIHSIMELDTILGVKKSETADTT